MDLSAFLETEESEQLDDLLHGEHKLIGVKKDGLFYHCFLLWDEKYWYFAHYQFLCLGRDKEFAIDIIWELEYGFVDAPKLGLKLVSASEVSIDGMSVLAGC